MLVYTQYRNDFHNDSKCRKKSTQCTCYKKYHKTTRVRCGGSYLHYAYAGHYGYRRSAFEYTSQSTIVASCRLMKLGLYVAYVWERTQACEPIDGHYRSNGQQLLLWCRQHWSLKPRPSNRKCYADCRPTLAIHWSQFEPVNSDEWRRSVALLTFC